ncbi:MAG: hypothetical protein QF535_01290 [Anaerolineales bacterium]|jgi:hypothetical protein|nr:hypothetical protein [Anaerolineales bacterium]
MSDIDKPQQDQITEPQDDSPQNTDEQVLDEGPEAEPEPTEEQLRADYFISDLRQKCQDENANVAFAIILDSKSQQPILYSKGSTYQITRVLADATKYFKNILLQELET